jgi:hypothetical protein
VLEDDQGNTLNIGRRSRIVPRAMSHALRSRDVGAGDLHADDCLDPRIDEHRVKLKWQGDSMDIQQSLQCMFDLEKLGE